jgi:hypothetical protein
MNDNVTFDDKPRRVRLLKPVSLVGAIAVGLCLLVYGPHFLTACDRLPPHVEAAVVLQGSVSAANARIAGAMHLVQTGAASRIVLSVPHESYWGEPSQPAARQFMQRTYGDGVSGKLEFCETGADVNSTEDEAFAVSACLREHGWPTIAVVTSNYHTRRARRVWRKIMAKNDPAAQIWMYGVEDPEFAAHAWWRKRVYAKTTFLEASKLVWRFLTGW